MSQFYYELNKACHFGDKLYLVILHTYKQLHISFEILYSIL